jgi:membrane protein
MFLVMTGLVAIAKATLRIGNEHHATRLAAAVAYAFIFAIAPLVIIIVGIAGTLVDLQAAHGGHTAVENALVGQISRAAGPAAGDAVRAMVTAGFGKMSSSLLAQAIGYVLLLVTASGAVGSLQGALNEIWDVPDRAGREGLWRMVRDRIAAIALVLALGLIVVIAFALNTLLGFGIGRVARVVPGIVTSGAAGWIGAVAGLAIAALIFAVMFRWLPDRRVAWADVGPGACVTALAFALGQAAIALYVGHAGFAGAYGVAGALFALLVWVYYSATIVLFGAAFTRATAEHRRPAAVSGTGSGTKSAA